MGIFCRRCNEATEDVDERVEASNKFEKMFFRKATCAQCGSKKAQRCKKPAEQAPPQAVITDETVSS